jgi:hypothetical protein
MQRLAGWWSRLPRPYRFNVGLYALASLAMLGLLFEVATGSGGTPKQVATQAPTIPSTTVTVFRPPLTISTVPESTSSTEASSTTVVTLPGDTAPAPTTATTARPVVTTSPSRGSGTTSPNTTSAPAATTTTPPTTAAPTTTTEAPTTTVPATTTSTVKILPTTTLVTLAP